MKRSYLWLLPIVALIVIAALVAWLSRPVPPPPVTPTIAPPPATLTATPRPTRVVPTRIPPTATARATVTPVVTVTPTVTPTARPTIAPSPPPVALRGVHRVRGGDTLWDVACEWYAGPLRRGANPLTPCTCWPGIAEHNGIEPPQFIGRGWVLQVPVRCGQ